MGKRERSGVMGVDEASGCRRRGGRIKCGGCSRWYLEAYSVSQVYSVFLSVWVSVAGGESNKERLRQGDRKRDCKDDENEGDKGRTVDKMVEGVWRKQPAAAVYSLRAQGASQHYGHKSFSSTCPGIGRVGEGRCQHLHVDVKKHNLAAVGVSWMTSFLFLSLD